MLRLSMKLGDRRLGKLFRRSWRAYGHANVTVVVDGISVPIVGHIGLDNLNWQNVDWI